MIFVGGFFFYARFTPESEDKSPISISDLSWSEAKGLSLPVTPIQVSSNEN